MPLLVSPIDGSPMKQINRYGIELDVCPTTGGIWLDKGELEKLLAVVQEAVDDSEQDYSRFKQDKAQKRLPQDYYEEHPAQRAYAPPYRKYDDDDYEDYHKYKHKKRSKLQSILNIFD